MTGVKPEGEGSEGTLNLATILGCCDLGVDWAEATSACGADR